MEKYFCNYNQALALKELGFKERTLFYFEGNVSKMHNSETGWDFNSSFKTCISRPLKAQVFEWFREKYKIGHDILCPFISFQGKDGRLNGGHPKFEMYVTDEEQLSIKDEEFYHNSYEEAESTAIDKLIELLK